MSVLTTVLELVALGLIVAGLVALALVFWPAAALGAGVGGLWLSRELTRRGTA